MISISEIFFDGVHYHLKKLLYSPCPHRLIAISRMCKIKPPKWAVILTSYPCGFFYDEPRIPGPLFSSGNSREPIQAILGIVHELQIHFARYNNIIIPSRYNYRTASKP